MINNLKKNFIGSESIDNNYSQANQDLFVLSCLNGKTNGTFLDLGCNDPVYISNTYLLENKFNWNGTAIDIESRHIDSFKEIRKCQAYRLDCTKINFEELLPEVNHIDYLSLDLEPASVTLDCLKRMPFNKIDFSIITFEHDFYRFGDNCRTLSREIFLDNGYHLLCSNVSNDGFIYEDWYVNPKYINIEDVAIFSSESLDHRKILFNNE